MQISIDISMYPLNSNFGTPILHFIKQLESRTDIEVLRNDFSTQLFGDYDTLMQLMTKEVKTAFETDDTVVMVMKIINKRVD